MFGILTLVTQQFVVLNTFLGTLKCIVEALLQYN